MLYLLQMKVSIYQPMNMSTGVLQQQIHHLYDMKKLILRTSYTSISFCEL